MNTASNMMAKWYQYPMMFLNSGTDPKM